MPKKKVKKFEFPQALLRQIDECSKGFLLVIIDQDDKFEVYRSFDNPVTQLGMLNFIDIFSQKSQEELRTNNED